MKFALPKSKIGKALSYSQSRWGNLNAYLYEGNLQIDNNLVENVIRAVALGGEDYLFVRPHEAAQKAAMTYTFFVNCKKNVVRP